MNACYMLYIRCNSTANSVLEFTINDCVEGRLTLDEVKTVTAALKLDLHNQGYYIASDYGSVTGSFEASKYTHSIEILAMPYGS